MKIWEGWDILECYKLNSTSKTLASFFSQQMSKCQSKWTQVESFPLNRDCSLNTSFTWTLFIKSSYLSQITLLQHKKITIIL